MDTVSQGARLAAVWLVALAAGLAAARAPAIGIALALVGAGVAIARPAVPPSAAAAALAAVVASAVLPALALAQDPFHAHPASFAWPLAVETAAFAGAGAAAWTFLARPLPPPELKDASPALRRLLLVEAGALAALLPISIAGTQIALAVLALTVAVAWTHGARPGLRASLDGPVLALLAAALAADLVGTHPVSPWGVTALRAMASYFVVSRGLALARPDARALGRLVAAWAVASAATSALAFWQHWSGFDLVAALGLRLPVQVPAPRAPGHFAGLGTFASRLRFAHATLTPLALLLGLRVEAADGDGRSFWSPWLWGVVALEAAGLWSTFARAAWLAAVALALAAMLLAARAKGRGGVLRGLAAAAAAAVIALGLSPGARAWGRAGLVPSDNRDRLFLWARAVEIAMDHQVRGVGFGGYPTVLGPYYDRFDRAFPMRTWAHDMPLSLLSETGPFGLFAGLWVVLAGLALARGSGPRRGLRLGAALATLAFALVALFHDALYDGQVSYSLFFALALAASCATGGAGGRTTGVEECAGLG